MSESPSILIVDDDSAVRAVLAGLLAQAGYRTIEADSGHEGLRQAGLHPVALVLSDVRMPSMDGLQLLAALSEQHPSLPVVMMTAHSSVEVAVEAMRRGAFDFLEKPVSRTDLLAVVQSAASLRPKSEVPQESEMIGRSDVLQSALRDLKQVAATDATVLLYGETGTGKEMAAEYVHQNSPRRDGPLVKLHCAALPEALLEAELFGHERGAFTGADHKKPGRVELAEKGTLFLDEVGEIPLSVQAKLLRLIQFKEYTPLGGVETKQADLRFVAATHRDLRTLVAKGAFREDLLYRLDVVAVTLPPLRDRGDDLIELSEVLLGRLSERHRCPQRVLSTGAQTSLLAHAWPGNVRELHNVCERLVVFGQRQSGEPIGQDEVFRALRRPLASTGFEASARDGSSDTEPRSLEAARHQAERDAIRAALKHSQANRTVAARLLGVSRRTLYAKMTELDIEI